MPAFPNAKPSFKEITIANGNYNQLAATKHHFTCPKGKIWEIDTVIMNPSDSSTATAVLYYLPRAGGATDAWGWYLINAGAGTANVTGPSTFGAVTFPQKPVLMVEDEYIECLFGTSQDAAGGYVSLRVWEYDREEVLKN